ncbi:MAG: nucleotidyltransferase domain-containing protein [Muribaculaceae bacterium]|nr:nucleotidyltransferase domain-containing protein [Muribaculaceae bacterium]
MKLIELYLPRIFEICKKYRVRSLAVFGSILTDKFNDNSDIDFIVNFDTTDHENWDYVTNFFDLKDALEKLLLRNVDLVVEKGLRNKIFIQNINRDKKVIYG